MNTSEATATEILQRPPGRAAGLRALAHLVLNSGDECAIWTGATAGQYRYPQVHVPHLYMQTGRGRVYGHRLVCEWEHGPPPTPVHQAAHSCGVTLCVNPRHIRWATPAENEADKLRHGTDPNGERNPMAKLTRQQVQAMRKRRSEFGTSYKALAELFGVSTMTAYRAVTGQSWSVAT